MIPFIKAIKEENIQRGEYSQQALFILLMKDNKTEILFCFVLVFFLFFFPQVRYSSGPHSGDFLVSERSLQLASRMPGDWQVNLSSAQQLNCQGSMNTIRQSHNLYICIHIYIYTFQVYILSSFYLNKMIQNRRNTAKQQKATKTFYGVNQT